MKRLSSGVDGMCSDYLGHFAVEYILSQNSVFSDQYRLSSDLPLSFIMLSAASPRRAPNLFISVHAGASGALASAQVHMHEHEHEPSVRLDDKQNRSDVAVRRLCFQRSSQERPDETNMKSGPL